MDFKCQMNKLTLGFAEWCEPSLCDHSGTAHMKRKWDHQKETEHISDLMPLHIGNFTQQRIPIHTLTANLPNFLTNIEWKSHECEAGL
jgi:hypothetical protein